MPGPDVCIWQTLSGLVLLGHRVYSARRASLSRWHLITALKEVRIASAVVPKWEVPGVLGEQPGGQCGWRGEGGEVREEEPH